MALLLVVMFLATLRTCYCVGASISITPSKLLLNASTTPIRGRVTVSCQAQALASGEVVSVMTIERVLHSNPNAAPTLLAEAHALIDNGSPSLENQGQGMSVSGNTNTGSLNLIMDQTNCKDGGMYTCTVATQSSGGPREDTASANLTVEVTPGVITLVATPSGRNSWFVNETLTIFCNGYVGSVHSNTQIHWVWEYKQTRDVTWSAYTDTSDIVTSSSVPGSSQPNVCYKRQTSTLTRRLTLEDDNREYRCYVRRDNRDYTEYAETLQVGAVDVPDTSTTRGNDGSTGSAGNAGNDEKTRSDDNVRNDYIQGLTAGVGIGAGVTAAVFIVAIVVLVLLFRKGRLPLPSTGGKNNDTIRVESDQLTEVYDVPFPVLPGAANTHGTPDNSGRLYLAPDGIMVNHHYDCYRQQQEEKKLRNTKKKKKRYRMGEEDEEEEKKKKIC